jgi:hypothetical protein
VDEYREAAGKEEGMNGLSTRFAFKILSETFNLRPDEVQANPIDLMYVLEEALKREHLQQEKLEVPVLPEGLVEAAIPAAHRQGTAYGVSGVLLRIRPDDVRELLPVR